MGDSKEISLTKDKKCLVDDNDYRFLMQWNWYFDGVGYAARNITLPDGTQQRITMHRLLTGTPDGFITDHINGNTLDNRKANLRIATTSLNAQNKKPSRRKIGIHKGVHFLSNGKWRAKIYIPSSEKGQRSKAIDLGSFKTELEAAVAYNEAARHHFGDFAKLNAV